MSSLALVFFSTMLWLSPAHAGLFSPPEGTLKTVTLTDLPVAPEPVGELWHLNAIPFSCSGCTTVYASKNGTRTVNAYTVPLGAFFESKFFPHPGGWEFRHVQDSCLNSRLEARRSGQQEISSVALLEKSRLAGFFSRRLSCIGGSSSVYHGIVANSRYLAFATAEPGFVFFDLQKGSFVPWALIDPRAGANLYTDQTGALFVDDGWTPSVGRTLYRVVLGGQDLGAPLSKALICSAREFAKKLDSNDRPAPGFYCPSSSHE